MGRVARLLLLIGCGLASGCDTLESVGDSLGELMPAASEPAPSDPLWEETSAPAAGGTAVTCRTNSASCPLDPPLASGAQCTCAAEGTVSIGVAAEAAQPN